MRKLWIPFLVATVGYSCSDSPVPTTRDSGTSGTNAGLTASILYTSGGGLLDRWNELEIDAQGLARGWAVDNVREARNPVGSRQLSVEELSKVRRLMEPFSGYSRYYKPEVIEPDGLTVRIRTQRDGTELAVDIYRPGETELPADLRSLIDLLGEVFESLR